MPCACRGVCGQWCECTRANIVCVPACHRQRPNPHCGRSADLDYNILPRGPAAFILGLVSLFRWSLDLLVRVVDRVRPHLTWAAFLVFAPVLVVMVLKSSFGQTLLYTACHYFDAYMSNSTVDAVVNRIAEMHVPAPSPGFDVPVLIRSDQEFFEMMLRGMIVVLYGISGTGKTFGIQNTLANLTSPSAYVSLRTQNNTVEAIQDVFHAFGVKGKSECKRSIFLFLSCLIPNSRCKRGDW